VGELGHIRQTCTLGLQRSVEIGEHLNALRIEIICTHELAFPRRRDLAGDEEEFGRLDPRDL
jgi:hypothetical protein